MRSEYAANEALQARAYAQAHRDMRRATLARQAREGAQRALVNTVAAVALGALMGIPAVLMVLSA